MHEKAEQIRTIWEGFVAGEAVDVSVLEPHVLHSWLLSREYQVDPFTALEPKVLSDQALHKVKREHSDLLYAASPVMQMVEVSLRNTGCIATLTVAPGYLLEVVGDDSAIVFAERRFNMVGAIRTLEAVGTSALMLSIIESKALQITGYEHYNKTFHHWSCSSAPIFDMNNTAMASLTISGHVVQQQKHTFALAKAAAETISTRMREKHLLSEQQRLNTMLQSIYDSLPEAVLFVGHDHRISHANMYAKQLLGGGKGILFGKLLEELVEKESVQRLVDAVKKDKPETLEVRFADTSMGQTAFTCRFVPLRVAGLPFGMTLLISSPSTVMDIARHVGGNYAKYDFHDIKGNSAALGIQLDLARRAAATGSRVLLTGESGTGKELFAQAIHNNSPHRNGPFVAVSCAAIPRDLIESELFGYVGGAFTGARKKGMIGKFELAGDGTLFLDEINSLPLDLQAKLLRVLQQREIVRIGDVHPIAVSARIISATNSNLLEAVNAGLFREDLYYRINVVEITIPPLRERKEDIPLLVRHIMQRQIKEARLPPSLVTPEAMHLFQHYDWPGNIRELDNICERVRLMALGEPVMPCHLPKHMQNHNQAALMSEGLSIENTCKQLIVQGMARHGGNLSKVAQDMGIARSTLYRKMHKFGITIG